MNQIELMDTCIFQKIGGHVSYEEWYRDIF
jgi:hypothetical protein